MFERTEDGSIIFNQFIKGVQIMCVTPFTYNQLKQTYQYFIKAENIMQGINIQQFGVPLHRAYSLAIKIDKTSEDPNIGEYRRNFHFKEFVATFIDSYNELLENEEERELLDPLPKLINYVLTSISHHFLVLLLTQRNQ
jgi:hypothetical protein